MADTVSDFLVRRLHEWGVRRIYGYPGDGINGIIGGFHEHGDRVEFVQTRHEEIAAFAAAADAKPTGEVGGPARGRRRRGGLLDRDAAPAAALDERPAPGWTGQPRQTRSGAT